MLLYAQIKYTNNSTVIYKVLEDQIYSNFDDTKNVKGEGEIRSQDLVAFLFYFNKNDAQNVKEEFLRRSLHFNFSHFHDNIEMLTYGAFKVFLYSKNYYILNLPLDIKLFFSFNGRRSINLTTHVVFMSLEDYIPSIWGQLFFMFYVDLGNVVANELAQAFPNTDGVLRELTGNSLWMWSDTQYKVQEPNHIKAFWLDLWHKFVVLLKAIAAFAILSVATAIVLRIGLMASSIFFIICCTF